MLTKGQALSPPISAGVECEESADTKRYSSRFPIARVDKRTKPIERIYTSLVPISLAFYFLLLSAPPLLLNFHPPPLVVMASGVPPSCYQSKNDLWVLRKTIGWQSLGYDSKMQRGMLSLTNPGDFIYFSSYALSGLVPPFSCFFLV
jgi:hypothetical protein